MDIFTKYLRTVKGIININAASTEIISDLGFTVNGVPVSDIKIGTLVKFSTTQDEQALTFEVAGSGDDPVGYIASKITFDFERKQYVTEIKLYGYIFEAASANVTVNGDKASFIAPLNTDTVKEYEVPSIAPDSVGVLYVIKAQPGVVAGEFICDVFVKSINTGMVV